MVGDLAEDAERGLKVEAVDHERAFWVFEEIVVVIESFEGSLDHGVPEVTWFIEFGDARAEALTDAKMRGLPGDLFAHFDKTGGPAGDSFFLGVGGGLQVQVDVAGEIEDSFARGVDQGLEVDDGHGGRSTRCGIMPVGSLVSRIPTCGISVQIVRN